MMLKQCVVRTGFKDIPYGYAHAIDALEEKLNEGYIVSMCNKIVYKDGKGGEYLEYILQKEVEE